jgi:nanoRNase/pAp phosphatase (c-di-AMP/oligoRNAs hydrolase)
MAYAFLQDRADLTLLRKLERPAYSIETARLFGAALTDMATAGDLAVVYLGTIADDDAHVLAEIADFGLSLSEITWAVAAAIIDNELVITIRHLGSAPGAGDLAKTMIANGGQGGGHVTMARAVLPLSAGVKSDAQELLQWVLSQCEVMRTNRQSAPQARPAKVHSAGPQ